LTREEYFEDYKLEINRESKFYWFMYKFYWKWFIKAYYKVCSKKENMLSLGPHFYTHEITTMRYKASISFKQSPFWGIFIYITVFIMVCSPLMWCFEL
jgi:hypothetical protein